MKLHNLIIAKALNKGVSMKYFYLLFVIIFMFSCNDSTSFSEGSGGSGVFSGDTVGLEDVQGSWLLTYEKNSFDTVVGPTIKKDKWRDIVTVRDSTIYVSSVDGLEISDFVYKLDLFPYLKSNVIIQNDSTFSFHHNGENGGYSLAFVPFDGDTSSEFFSKVDSSEVKQFRLPTDLQGNWFASREMYHSGWNDYGEIGGNYFDDSCQTIDESDELIVITADSIIRYKKDEGKIEESKLLHFDLRDFEYAVLKGNKIIEKGCEYEVYGGESCYSGYAGISEYTRTNYKTPPESWYE